jgi:NADP-reducing hydrogenase subunit HndD
VNFRAVRGVEGIKEATVQMGDVDVRVAVAHSTSEASRLLDSIKSGKSSYHFVEVMGCPGGCVNGGGQPIVPSPIRSITDIRVERAQALYHEDEAKKIRKSHENPEIKRIYAEYLGKPNGHLTHRLLHTQYQKQPAYGEAGPNQKVSK